MVNIASEAQNVCIQARNLANEHTGDIKIKNMEEIRKKSIGKYRGGINKYYFRFWDKKKKIMIYDKYQLKNPIDLSVNQNGRIINPKDARADVRYIPMLWTGIDFCPDLKTGKQELWEGDIVSLDKYEVVLEKKPALTFFLKSLNPKKKNLPLSPRVVNRIILLGDKYE